MQKTVLVVAILFGLFSGASMAQEAPTALTEAAAVQLAVRNHPALRMAQAEAGMAQARIGIARAEGALQASLNGLATISNSRNVIAVQNVMPQALLPSQEKSSIDLNGMLMLPLATGGRITQTVRAATLSAAATQQQVAATQVQVAADARIRYAEWRQAIALEAVAQSTVTAQTRNTETAQQLFDAGKAPKFDALRAQAELASAQQQLANAHADVLAAQARLRQAVGATVETAWTPADEPLSAPPANALQTGLARRPDLLAAQQNIAAAEATVKARKANYRPQLYAVGMLDAFTPADNETNTGVTVGLVAGVPILDGGRRHAEVGEAEQAVAQACAARDNVVLQVRADVGAAEPRVAAARQNIDTAQAQVLAAEESFTVAQARYGAGKGAIIELLDAQRILTEARQNLVTAQTQYRAALAELYRAMGVVTI